MPGATADARSPARGLVAPFVMSALVQFGLVSVTVGLLLCSAASGTGVALFWWAARRAREEAIVAPTVAATTR